MPDPNYNSVPRGGYAPDCDDVRRMAQGPVYCAGCGKKLLGGFYVFAGVPLCDLCAEGYAHIEEISR